MWPKTLARRTHDVQAAVRLFTSPKSAQYVEILRPGRKQTSKNQEVLSIFVYFHTLGLSFMPTIIMRVSDYTRNHHLIVSIVMIDRENSHALRSC